MIAQLYFDVSWLHCWGLLQGFEENHLITRMPLINDEVCYKKIVGNYIRDVFRVEGVFWRWVGRQHHGQLSRSQTPAASWSDYYSSQTPSRITVLVDTFICALSILSCWLCSFNIVTFCLDFKGETKASCHTSVIITTLKVSFFQGMVYETESI